MLLRRNSKMVGAGSAIKHHFQENSALGNGNLRQARRSESRNVGRIIRHGRRSPVRCSTPISTRRIETPCRAGAKGGAFEKEKRCDNGSAESLSIVLGGASFFRNGSLAINH